MRSSADSCRSFIRFGAGGSAAGRPANLRIRTRTRTAAACGAHGGVVPEVHAGSGLRPGRTIADDKHGTPIFGQAGLLGNRRRPTPAGVGVGHRRATGPDDEREKVRGDRHEHDLTSQQPGRSGFATSRQNDRRNNCGDDQDEHCETLPCRTHGRERRRGWNRSAIRRTG